MSAIVAIKDNGKVYFGADSQTTCGGKKNVNVCHGNFKIVAPKSDNHCIVGAVGPGRNGEIIRAIDQFIPSDYDGEIDIKFMVHHIVPLIFDELKKYDRLETDKDDGTPCMSGRVLFAYKDKLFVMYSDGAVDEIVNYAAIGSAEDEIMGSLMSTEEQEPTKRILKSLSVAARYSIYVSGPFVLADTESCEARIYDGE